MNSTEQQDRGFNIIIEDNQRALSSVDNSPGLQTNSVLLIADEEEQPRQRSECMSNKIIEVEKQSQEDILLKQNPTEGKLIKEENKILEFIDRAAEAMKISQLAATHNLSEKLSSFPRFERLLKEMHSLAETVENHEEEAGRRRWFSCSAIFFNLFISIVLAVSISLLVFYKYEVE